jgi:hypothetical protein
VPLDTTRAIARALDALDEPELLARWQPYLEEVLLGAHRVATSSGLESAAENVAVVGRACGRCHEATATRVPFQTAGRPGDHSTLANDMAAHQWAALQMWQGLIGPADDLWQPGATG